MKFRDFFENEIITIQEIMAINTMHKKDGIVIVHGYVYVKAFFVQNFWNPFCNNGDLQKEKHKLCLI